MPGTWNVFGSSLFVYTISIVIIKHVEVMMNHGDRVLAGMKNELSNLISCISVVLIYR